MAPRGKRVGLYASTHGHTAKIATRIAETMRAQGLDVDLRDASEAGDADPGRYEGVIVGASLHGGHHQREVVQWVSRHRAAVESRPSAFFSVSLTAAEDTDEARLATQRCIDDFLDDTGWTPARTVSVAVRCSIGSTTSSPAS